MCFFKNELEGNCLSQKRLRSDRCDRPRFVG